MDSTAALPQRHAVQRKCISGHSSRVAFDRAISSSRCQTLSLDVAIQATSGVNIRHSSRRRSAKYSRDIRVYQESLSSQSPAAAQLRPFLGRKFADITSSRDILALASPSYQGISSCRRGSSVHVARCSSSSSGSVNDAATTELKEGAVLVQDDLDHLLMCLPEHLRETLLRHPRRSELLEVVLDLGRRPEARFLGDGPGEYLQDREISREDLECAQLCLGEFGGDNRAGVEGTLHRISCIRNRRGTVVGLTCRVGRAVTGHVDMVRDLLHSGNSLLFLGRPGVGKTTVIREIARVLSDELHKRVVIVDTSNEIGGDGDVPHPAIGTARRMQVPDPAEQHRVMVEAVENHMPQVVIVDEIGTEAEALACRSIAERGVMLVGTAHGQLLENLMKNPTLCDLVGGVQTVTLGDEEARSRGTQKSVLERKAPPTFPVLIEMRERHFWVAHQTDRSVDALLHGKRPLVEVRSRDPDYKVNVERKLYDRNGTAVSPGAGSGFGRDDIDAPSNLIGWGDPVGGAALAASTAAAAASQNSSLQFVTITAGRGARENFAREMNSPEDIDATYMWAARLGHVPDKDAITDALPASRRVSSWAELDEEFYGTSGYGSGGNSGKRGSKRGPRGLRPR